MDTRLEEELLLLGGRKKFYNPARDSSTIDLHESDLGTNILGGKLAGWVDQSPGHTGPDYAQITAGERPTYAASGGPNNLPTITFDGIDDLLLGITTLMSGRTKYTATFVNKHNADGVCLNCNNDSIGDQTYLGNRLCRFGAPPGFGGFAQALGSYHIVQYVYDGSQPTNATRLKMYEDGVQKTVDFGAYTVPAVLDATTAMYLGRYNIAGFFFKGVMIAYCYSSDISDATRINHLRYWKRKTGL